MTKTGMDLINAERARQVGVEGWTPEHDDEHVNGELLAAANCYQRIGTPHNLPLRPDGIPASWPWEVWWWKPRDRLSNLVRAGALALAEMQRLDRSGMSSRRASVKVTRISNDIDEMSNE